MQRDEIDELLHQGKEAARRADHSLALIHLRKVVEADPENEVAWLWLSAVVESDEDRRLCLENVLHLNPTNEAARRGLRQLRASESEEPQDASPIVIRRVPSLTPAGAILYPERQDKSWRWEDRIALRQETAVAGFSAESSFNDVWQRDVDLCAYCAAELSEDDRRCSGCGRRLEHTSFRYPKASNNLIIYCVLILGIAQIALATVILTLLSHGSPATLAWHSLVFAIMIVLAAGLAFRRFWAYVASIVALLMVLTAILFGRYLGPAVDDSLAQLTGREFFLLVNDRPITLFVGPLGNLLRYLHYLAVPLALLVALFRVGPDFERLRGRIVARLDRGISDASHFYGAGADYGARGMWATAALHFQRAAALEPANAFYQRALGEAYAKLGHYQRSIDVLESANRLTRDPEIRATIDRQIVEMRRLQARVQSEAQL